MNIILAKALPSRAGGLLTVLAGCIPVCMFASSTTGTDWLFGTITFRSFPSGPYQVYVQSFNCMRMQFNYIFWVCFSISSRPPVPPVLIQFSLVWYRLQTATVLFVELSRVQSYLPGQTEQ